MHTTHYTIERDGEEIDLEIEYEVAPYYPTRLYPWPGEPAEGGEITALTAYRDGKPFALTEAEDNKIEEWIYDNHDYD